MSSRPLRIGVLLGSQLAVGSAALMARAGLEAGAGPLELAFWRLVVAWVVVSVLVRLLPTPSAPLTGRDRWVAVGGGLFLGWHFALWFFSLGRISVALSTLLVCTSPIWAGLLEAAVLRRPPKRMFWLGVATALAGVALVVGAERVGGGSDLLLGGLAAVAGAACLVPYLLAGKVLQRRYGLWRSVGWTYGLAGATLAPLLALSGGWSRLAPPSAPTVWLAVVGMALVPQMMGHTALNWSMRWFPASTVGLATLLEPIFAALLAWPLFGEPLRPLQGVGAAVLLLGVGLGIGAEEGRD
ncbi:MAG: DMT family transporter [Armatimonadetes bacterium]|nr:DMT family transporter [Armatimonadota bacterium]